jgi:hypothetical protein
MKLSRIIQKLRGPRTAGADGEYRLVFPRRVDRRRLLRETSGLLGADRNRVRQWFKEYRRLHEEHRYQERFGERKTLNFEEAFVVYAILARTRPDGPIVEIGTQYGRSTRRILDMLPALGLENEVVCFDVEDQVNAFEPEEARLVIEDLTGKFRHRVLDELSPSLVYLDAHPYYLTREVILDVLEHSHDCALVMHDSGRALCNPNMTISRDDPASITSATGHWERHVLCEVFGVADPMDDDIDYQETPTHLLRIFATTHGLATIVPRSVSTPGG